MSTGRLKTSTGQEDVPGRTFRITGRPGASQTSLTEGAQRMPNDRLRAAMHASRIDALALAAGVPVDVKTVERWLAGRVPHSRHRTAVARIVGRTELQLWPTARPSAAHDGDSGEVLAVYAHRTDLPVEEWWRLLTQANERIDLFAYALLFLPEGHPRARRAADREGDGRREHPDRAG